ncbi:MAG: hypothetical protein ACR2J3_09985 [Aridibacter sp.]
MHNLDFEKLTTYDSGKPGITVDVEIQLLDINVNLTAKIDTGSEACIFARNLGEELGLEIESGEPEKFRTVTNSFLTFGHWVTLTVEDFTFDSYVYFAEEESFQRNVLGRHGWLDRVIIGINDYDGKLYLSKYESK